MLYEEREKRILQQLQLQSTVRVSQLSQLLQVSVDTVRRDLKAMEQKGLIRCLRGGASLPESRMSLSNFKGRELIHEEEKRGAARKALAYIKEGDIIAMNSGTTNTVLAQEMLEVREPVTVVTNNLAAANILMQNGAIRLILIGGMLDAPEQSTYGAVCEQEFARYFPDVCFLSINAVNYQDGFTDFRMHEIPVIQRLASISRQVVAVMDSSKLGKRSKVKVLEPDQVDLLVMESQVPPEVRERYEKAGFRIAE